MKVPKFINIKEERKFWDTHDSTDYLDDFEEAKDVVSVRPKKQFVTLRLEPQYLLIGLPQIQFHQSELEILGASP